MTESKTTEPYRGDNRWFRIGWALTSTLPTRRGSGLRRWLLGKAGARVAPGVLLGPHVRILGPQGLEIGEGAGVARHACLDARGGLTIEAGALIGFEALLLTWTHRWDSPEAPIAGQGFVGGAVRVGENAWIGARAILLPGTRVGSFSVVGAASVVTRDVASHDVVGGNPARVLRSR